MEYFDSSKPNLISVPERERGLNRWNIFGCLQSCEMQNGVFENDGTVFLSLTRGKCQNCRWGWKGGSPPPVAVPAGWFRGSLETNTRCHCQGL